MWDGRLSGSGLASRRPHTEAIFPSFLRLPMNDEKHAHGWRDRLGGEKLGARKGLLKKATAKD